MYSSLDDDNNNNNEKNPVRLPGITINMPGSKSSVLDHVAVDVNAIAFLI